ncbi:MAG: hypothetical protein HY817_04065 [Candidatus Abawacabacteria bacterium]|nr:hypothetical protein [Candidatus Abawacabacteria bacterium]
MKKVVWPLLIGIILAGGLYLGLAYLDRDPDWMYEAPVTEDNHKYHVHSDFAVYLDGQKFNFGQEKYMTSTDTCAAGSQSHSLHMHDLNGNVAHVHAEVQTWADFFQAINFALTDNSFTTDEGKVYQNEGSKKLRFFVNKQELASLKDYQFKDLDQVLITYGNSSVAVIEQQLNSITKQACIFSKVCPVPEGMILPQENCSA